MPQISYFLVVIIRMFYRDHNPPHFHAVYADFEGIIDIERNEIIGSQLPPRVLGIVRMDSTSSKRINGELERARIQELLHSIAPLV